jgi:hypothetical protein
MKSGDKCERCSEGHLVIYCSRQLGDDPTKRIGYLHCYACKFKPTSNCIEYESRRKPRVPKLRIQRQGSSSEFVDA